LVVDFAIIFGGEARAEIVFSTFRIVFLAEGTSKIKSRGAMLGVWKAFNNVAGGGFCHVVFFSFNCENGEMQGRTVGVGFRNHGLLISGDGLVVVVGLAPRPARPKPSFFTE